MYRFDHLPNTEIYAQPFRPDSTGKSGIGKSPDGLEGPVNDCINPAKTPDPRPVLNALWHKVETGLRERGDIRMEL